MIDDMESKHYKVLILAMSCEDDFFKMSRYVTHDTWAKSVIEGKNEGIGFLSYTSTEDDERIEDNTVYVKVPDLITDTYRKTIRCFEFLRENGITFDYVLRTNTSVYFNIPITIRDIINPVIENSIDLYSEWRGFINFRGEDYPEFHGSMFVMSSKLIYDIVDSDIDENSPDVVEYVTSNNKGTVGIDDITISAITYLLNERNGYKYNIYITKDRNMIRYKPVSKLYLNTCGNESIRKSMNEYAESCKVAYTDSPDVINFIPFIQYRILTPAFPIELRYIDSNFRIIELEHAYELHEANIYK